VVVWGVSSRIADGRPVVVGVEVSGSRIAPAGRAVFDHRGDPGDMARALLLLAQHLEQELAKSPPRVVVVRAMDWFLARRESVARPRLQVEGVLLEASRRSVPTVVALSGKDIGRVCGLEKAQIKAEAARLLPGLDEDAAMAGLAALAIGEKAT
jgi:hypothetical protein